jgi:lipopolysaccharide O-acetyltransferase
MDILKKLKIYGILGFLRLLIDRMFSMIIIPSARIIRRPLYVRGWKYINWGENLTSGVGLRLDVFDNLHKNPIVIFGKNCQVNDYVHIAAMESIVFGDNVLIASKVFITDHNHGDFYGNPEISLAPALRTEVSSPVIIESNVWLGEGVSVLPGVTIGESSVVGAGSVVTRDVPAFSLAVGSPAHVIKKYCERSDRWESIK